MLVMVSGYSAPDLCRFLATSSIGSSVMTQVQDNEFLIPLSHGGLGIERADKIRVGLDRYGSSPDVAATAPLAKSPVVRTEPEMDQPG